MLVSIDPTNRLPAEDDPAALRDDASRYGLAAVAAVRAAQDGSALSLRLYQRDSYDFARLAARAALARNWDFEAR